MDARKYFGLHFLTLENVGGKRLREVIDRIEEGKFNKVNCIFESGNALSLNATNTRALVRALGAETDLWPGYVLELYVGEVEYQGKMQPGVLLEVISPPLQAPPPKAAEKSDSDMDDDVPF